jgi:hypothetical protein
VNTLKGMHDNGALNDEESPMKQQPRRSNVVLMVDPDGVPQANEGTLQIGNNRPPSQQSLATSRLSSSTTRDHQVHCTMRNLREPGAQSVPGSHRFYRRQQQAEISTEFTVAQPPSDCIMTEAETSPAILKADKVESPILAEAKAMRLRSGKVLFRVSVIAFMVALLAVGVYVAVIVSRSRTTSENEDLNDDK